ncbi:MAG: hypothetical protein AAGC77_05285 [Pseudomonadota bacterium]
MKIAKPTPLAVVTIVFGAAFFARGIEFASAAANASATLDTKSETPIGPTDLMPSKPTKAVDAAAMAPIEKPVAVQAVSAPAMSDVGRETTVLKGFSSDDANTLLGEIRERALAIQQREAALANRAKTLEAVEKRVDEKIESLNKAQKDLEARLSIAETAAQDDISHLARMYENMKPDKAGEIFNAMDATFAAGFLTEMNSESAAQILSNMETEKAYAASIMIAGRNARINAR